MTTEQAFALAVQHHQAGQLREAEALYRQVVAAWPDHAEAHLNLGGMLVMRGSVDEAVAHCRRALELQPGWAEAYNNLGYAFCRQGKPEEAIAACREALRLKPDYAEAQNNLGIAFADQGRLDEAVDAYRQALALQPRFAEAQVNLGVALRDLGQLEEAIAAHRHAVELAPASAPAHNNLGIALKDSGRLDEAEAAYRRALQLQPNYARAQFNLALLLLLRGDYTEGWRWYEARWPALRAERRNFPQPQYDGRSADGQRVLVYAEQGLGDSIQFVRYATLIARRGGRVIVECQSSLVELFRSARDVEDVIAGGGALPAFDAHVAMLSQPLVFGTTRETIPAEVSYLFADPARREVWRERLGQDRRRLRVGFAWAGNPQNIRLRERHIPLPRLLPLLCVEGVDFFSLQVDQGTEQLRELSGAATVIDHTAHLVDFSETAAFMAELDLIISVDTAVAHLAGALGRPVWTLLAFVPDWRWGPQGETTPWYPTMRLFRQPAADDWESVVQRVVEALRERSRGG